MPKYFFDVQDGEGTFIDEVGVDLPDMDAAIREARRALADMVRESLREPMRESLSIAIRDGADGPVVLSVTLTTATPGTAGRADDGWDDLKQWPQRQRTRTRPR